MDKYNELREYLNTNGLDYENINFDKSILNRTTNKIKCIVIDDSLNKFYKDSVECIVFVSLNDKRQGTLPRVLNEKNEYSIYNINKIIKNIKSDSKLISDVYTGNKKKMLFECNCGNLFEKRWNNFYSENQRRCKECSDKMKVDGYNNSKISKNGSFKEYLIQLYGEDWINVYDFDKNKINPNDVQKNSYEVIWVKCLEHKDHPSFQVQCCYFEQQYKCLYCNSFGHNYPNLAKYFSKKNEDNIYEINRCSGKKYWFECPNGKHLDSYKAINDVIRRGCICSQCSFEKRSGENCPSWRGGVSSLRLYFRSKINNWKRKVIKEGEYTCDITGEFGDFEVHHLTSFNDIFLEFVEKYDIEIKTEISEYEREYLNYLGDMFGYYHDKIAQGVILRKDLHILFHNIYGRNKGDNTPEQYYEFKKDFKNGKYNDLIK